VTNNLAYNEIAGLKKKRFTALNPDVTVAKLFFFAIKVFVQIEFLLAK